MNEGPKMETVVLIVALMLSGAVCADFLQPRISLHFEAQFAIDSTATERRKFRKASTSAEPMSYGQPNLS